MTMHQPDLARADATTGSKMLSGGNVFAIGSPCRAVKQPIGLLCNRRGAFPVPVHDPDIVTAPAVTCEGDLFSIWTESGLHIPGWAFGKRGGISTVDR